MSLQKIHNSTQKRRVRSNRIKPRSAQAPQGELELSFDSWACECSVDPQEFVREFLSDLRHMCQLIEEAGRYGTTSAMEHNYSKLRTSLARGYRLVKEESGIDLFPSAGFHGSSFEMIFSSYSLDSLVRGPGLRVVERLAEIWRTAHSTKLPVRRKCNTHA